MSLYFNSGNSGILQRIERELGYEPGYITGNTTRLSQWTADVNLALDDAWSIILPASGTWKLDDSNYDNTSGGYPIISTNLIANQRDYQFTSDSFGNYILDIYKVFVANSSGIFSEISPVDVDTGIANLVSNSGTESADNIDLSSFTNAQNGTGIPTRYDKQANAIFLDPIPSYSYSNGLKIYINREASYFTVSDTTKRPGFAGLFHEYCVINPVYKFALSKNMSIAQGLVLRKQDIEQRMISYYGKRSKDERKRLIPNIESNK